MPDHHARQDKQVFFPGILDYGNAGAGQEKYQSQVHNIAGNHGKQIPCNCSARVSWAMHIWMYLHCPRPPRETSLFMCILEKAHDVFMAHRASTGKLQKIPWLFLTDFAVLNPTTTGNIFWACPGLVHL